MSNLFDNIRPLRPKDDASLRVRAQTSFAFAAGTDLIPIVESEAAAAAREFVIVFPRQTAGLPQLVASLGDGRNAYVNDSGRWMANFVPQHVANYPFFLAEQAADQASSEGKRVYALWIAPRAPHFSTQEGVRLFGDDGAASFALRSIEERLVAAQAQVERTQFMVQQIADAGLLTTATLPVKLDEARAVGLAGAKVVDRSKFDALAPAALEKLRESGALGLVQSHLMSLRNLERSQLQQYAVLSRSNGQVSGGLLQTALANRSASTAGTQSSAANATSALQNLLSRN